MQSPPAVEMTSDSVAVAIDSVAARGSQRLMAGAAPRHRLALEQELVHFYAFINGGFRTEADGLRGSFFLLMFC